MENKKHSSIEEAILGKIRGHELAMHPKYYFYLRVAVLIAVSVAALTVSVFILNFILFSIRINSEDVFLGFGPRGFGAFLAFFPWDLFAADIVLLCMLLWLLRQFKFGYRSPLLYILVGVVVLTAAAGFTLDRTSGLNERFLRAADEHRLPPPFGDFYGHARRLPPQGSGICRACTVLVIEGNILTVQELRGTTAVLFTVVLPLSDPNATTSMLRVGDIVFIAGEAQGGVIEAFGMRKMK